MVMLGRYIILIFICFDTTIIYAVCIKFQGLPKLGKLPVVVERNLQIREKETTQSTLASLLKEIAQSKSTLSHLLNI